MLETFAEGVPYSPLVLLVGLAASAMAALQCIARARPRGGLVLGFLGLHLGLMLAFATHLLASSLVATGGADAASKATVIAFGVSCSTSIFLIGGGVGTVGAGIAVLAALLGPSRRAELALRALALLLVFATLTEFARRIHGALSAIAGAEPTVRGSLALVGLGESFEVLPYGLGLAAVLVIAAGIASGSESTPATS